MGHLLRNAVTYGERSLEREGTVEIGKRGKTKKIAIASSSSS